MDYLIAFLNARLDEDEAAAKAAASVAGPDWTWKTEVPEGHDEPTDYITSPAGTYLADTMFGIGDLAPHMARQDPARVLREVAAKRAIRSRHMPHEPAFGGPACNWCSDDVDDRPQLAKERWPCPDVRSLAAVYSDHPDYRAEWAPVTAG